MRQKAKVVEVNYEISLSLNKHLGIRHFELRVYCLNYPKQTDHVGLSPGLKVFLTDICVLA